jgi:hydrogenase-4 component F
MMFFLSGNILMKYHSRSLDVVKGLMQAAPLTSFFLLGGVFALVGVPPFNIFLSKFMIVSAGIATGHLLVIILCLLLLMVAFVAFFRMLSSVVFGQKPESVAKGEKGLTTLAPIVILMVLIVALGVSAPTPLYALMDRATRVVNEGIPIVQSAETGVPTEAITRSLGLGEAQPPVSLFEPNPATKMLSQWPGLEMLQRDTGATR